MPNPGDLVPYGDDYIARRQDDAARRAREADAARGLGASQIGNGGVLQVDGSLQVNGSISTPGTLNSAGGLTATAGNIAAPAGNITAGLAISAVGAVSAGGNISTPATVSGGTVTSTGDVTAAGNVIANGSGVFPAGLSSAGAYNNLLTSGYRVSYVSAAAYGYVPSSRQFKRDIVTADLSEESWLALRLVNFRYIAAVDEFGDEAAVEIGLIAEEVHSLGLHWLVDYDEEGKPFGVKYDKLALLLVPAFQSIDARLRAAGL